MSRGAAVSPAADGDPVSKEESALFRSLEEFLFSPDVERHLAEALWEDHKDPGSRQYRAAGLDARLAMDALRHLSHVPGRPVTTALRDELASVERALPSTFFSGLSTSERVDRLVHHWQRATAVLKDLGEDVDLSEGTRVALICTCRCHRALVDQVSGATFRGRAIDESCPACRSSHDEAAR